MTDDEKALEQKIFGLFKLEDAGLTEADWEAASDFGDMREKAWKDVHIDDDLFNAQMTDAFLCGIAWERKRAARIRDGKEG